MTDLSIETHWQGRGARASTLCEFDCAQDEVQWPHRGQMCVTRIDLYPDVRVDAGFAVERRGMEQMQNGARILFRGQQPCRGR